MTSDVCAKSYGARLGIISAAVACAEHAAFGKDAMSAVEQDTGH